MQPNKEKDFRCIPVDKNLDPWDHMRKCSGWTLPAGRELGQAQCPRNVGGVLDPRHIVGKGHENLAGHPPLEHLPFQLPIVEAVAYDEALLDGFEPARQLAHLVFGHVGVLKHLDGRLGLVLDPLKPFVHPGLAVGASWENGLTMMAEYISALGMG